MKYLEYKIVKDAIIVNNETCDAMFVIGYHIPVKKNQVIGTNLLDGYRCIVVDGVHYQFHRSIHECGRPQLFNRILELMQALNK